MTSAGAFDGYLRHRMEVGGTPVTRPQVEANRRR